MERISKDNCRQSWNKASSAAVIRNLNPRYGSQILRKWIKHKNCVDHTVMILLGESNPTNDYTNQETGWSEYLKVLNRRQSCNHARIRTCCTIPGTQKETGCSISSRFPPRQRYKPWAGNKWTQIKRKGTHRHDGPRWESNTAWQWYCFTTEGMRCIVCLFV